VRVRGQLWGQVWNINFLHPTKSRRYTEYSGVLATVVANGFDAGQKPIKRSGCRKAVAGFPIFFNRFTENMTILLADWG
jgi:hypothetical protein